MLWLVLVAAVLLLVGCLMPPPMGYDTHSWRQEERLPDRNTIDKPGKCEVRRVLVRTTGEYKCREYRC